MKNHPDNLIFRLLSRNGLITCYASGGNKLNTAKFRKEIVNIMPGYSWTVHRPNKFTKSYLSATGIQSSGFNRLSTLQIIRREKEDRVEYEAKSSGFGLRSPWLATYTGRTLAQALRGLQSHYEQMASEYSNHASAIEYARAKKHNKRIHEDAQKDAHL